MNIQVSKPTAQRSFSLPPLLLSSVAFQKCPKRRHTLQNGAQPVSLVLGLAFKQRYLWSSKTRLTDRPAPAHSLQTIRDTRSGWDTVPRPLHPLPPSLTSLKLRDVFNHVVHDPTVRQWPLHLHFFPFPS